MRISHSNVISAIKYVLIEGHRKRLMISLLLSETVIDILVYTNNEEV